MTDDLISRKKAIEAVKNEMLSWLDGDSHDYRKVVDAIMDLPTEPQWIPCSERLPDAGKIVLVYGKRGGIYTAIYSNPRTSWGNGWWKLNSKSHNCMPEAWMPLPEPYEVAK